MSVGETSSIKEEQVNNYHLLLFAAARQVEYCGQNVRIMVSIEEEYVKLLLNFIG